MSSRPIGVDYVERQVGARCCLHALNNVVGERAFEAAQFLAVRGKAGWWGDAELEGVLRESSAYERVGFDRVAVGRRSLFELLATAPGFLGFVVKRNEAHWVALRRAAPDDASRSDYEVVDSLRGVAEPTSFEAAWSYLDALRGNHHAIFRASTPLVAALLEDRKARRALNREAARGSKRVRRAVELE